MKVNEIITEAGVLNTIGKGIGTVAAAPFRFLNWAAGGEPTEVGTASQRADAAAKQAKKQQKNLAAGNQAAVSQAYQHFEQSVAGQGVKLNDPRTYTQDLKSMLQAFANYYYGSDHTTGPIIQKEISKIPLPSTLNPGSVKQYLDQTGKVFVDVNANQLGYQVKHQQEQEKLVKAAEGFAYQVYTKQMGLNDVPPDLQNAVAANLKDQTLLAKFNEFAAHQGLQQGGQQGPQLAQGVSVVSSNPVILRYGKQDYYIADDGMWHAMNNRNPLPDAWQQFFDQQAEIAEPQRQVVQQPTPVRQAQPTQPVRQAQPTQPRFQQPTQQRTAPTPDEIRQQKQAQAIQRAQQELQGKPKIKVRPGETMDQATARARGGK